VLVSNLIREPVCLVENFLASLHCLEANIRMEYSLGHDHFLPNLLHFIIHLLSNTRRYKVSIIKSSLNNPQKITAIVADVYSVCYLNRVVKFVVNNYISEQVKQL
jgi:hypothetical protein